MEVQRVLEIIDSKEFLSELRKEIGQIKAIIKRRPTGVNYKRTYIDRLGDNFNAQYFQKNIIAIWNKKSKLNKEQREVISLFCNKAVWNIENNNK